MKKMYFLLSLVILSAESAQAAAGAEGGVPTQFVLVQILNVSLLIGILIYFLKDRVVEYFAERQRSFNDLMKRAEIARQKAEEEKNEILRKLEKLENEAKETQATAEQEAAKVREETLERARKSAQRLKSEAESQATFEMENAVETLRLELLNESIELSRNLLKKKVEAQDQKRLQTEFVEKVQVAQ